MLLDILSYTSPVIEQDVGKYEPLTRYKRNGFQAYANGVDWNPGGTGIGLYRYDTATPWVKIG